MKWIRLAHATLPTFVAPILNINQEVPFVFLFTYVWNHLAATHCRQHLMHVELGQWMQIPPIHTLWRCLVSHTWSITTTCDRSRISDQQGPMKCSESSFLRLTMLAVLQHIAGLFNRVLEFADIIFLRVKFCIVDCGFHKNEGEDTFPCRSHAERGSEG